MIISCWNVLILFILVNDVRSITYNEYLGNETIFDILMVRDAEMLNNMMDPRSLREEVGDLVNQTINFDPTGVTVESIEESLQVLHDELETIYLKLYSIAKFLTYVTPEEFIAIADKLVDSDAYYSIFEPNHPHRDFGFNHALSVNLQELEQLRLEPEYDQDHGDDDDDHEVDDDDDEDADDLQKILQGVDEEMAKDEEFWDTDEDFELLLLELEGEDPEKVEVAASILSSFKIFKKIKKSIRKKKKKFALILKLIKLKKVLKIKKNMLCIKIMILIEKIKRTIILIISLLKKLIIYLIKEFPFDVLWKVKQVIRLIVKIIDDALWATEIATLTVILKVVTLIKLGVRFQIEVIMYLKMIFLEKISNLKRLAFGLYKKIKGIDEEEDYITFKEYNVHYDYDYDYDFADEVFGDGDDDDDDGFYSEGGIEYVQADPNYRNEIDNLYEESFPRSTTIEFLKKYASFNLEVEYEDEDESDSEYGIAKRHLKSILEDFEIGILRLGFETNSSGDTFSDKSENQNLDFKPSLVAFNSGIISELVDSNLTVFRTIQGFTSIASSVRQPVMMATAVSMIITISLVVRRF